MDKTLQSMEDTLLPLKVKSNLSDYVVTFHNSIEKLLNTLDKKSWFIIDENLNQYYDLRLSQLVDL